MKPCVTRAGLKLGPPCVISLEYNSPARGARKKNVTLKRLGQDGEGVDAITRKIVKAVEQCLIINAAAELGIGKLVACALAHVLPSARGSHGSSSASVGGQDAVAGLKLRGDDVNLNHLSDAELAKYKSLMEEDFRKNQLKPGDAGFEYDKQVEFEPATEDNDWDESEEDV